MACGCGPKRASWIDSTSSETSSRPAPAAMPMAMVRPVVGWPKPRFCGFAPMMLRHSVSASTTTEPLLQSCSTKRFVGLNNRARPAGDLRNSARPSMAAGLPLRMMSTASNWVTIRLTPTMSCATNNAPMRRATNPAARQPGHKALNAGWYDSTADIGAGRPTGRPGALTSSIRFGLPHRRAKALCVERAGQAHVLRQREAPPRMFGARPAASAAASM